MSGKNEANAAKHEALRKRVRSRRDRGLCVRCGKPALKSQKRGLDVNRRLARGEGLPDEYVRATRGKWRPGDPIPTFEHLTHEAFCAPCKLTATRNTRASKDKRAAALNQNARLAERRRSSYVAREQNGVCRRCGITPIEPDSESVECRPCREKREKRAIESPHANEIAERLLAGESQHSIRTLLGAPGSMVQPIAAMLRRTGRLPEANNRPVDASVIEKTVELRAAGKTIKQIAEIIGRHPRTIAKWLQRRAKGNAGT